MTQAKVIGRIDIDNSTTKNDVKVERKGNTIYFSVPLMISSHKAIDLQGDLGWPAGGYGFYSYKESPTETTWNCSTSSD